MKFLYSPLWPRLVVLGIALLLFPILAYWIWGGGWMSQRGFYDFGGGTAVHFTVGLCALIGAAIAGPRPNRVWGQPPVNNRKIIFTGTILFLFGLFAYDPASMLETLFDRGSLGLTIGNFVAGSFAGAFTAGGLMALRENGWQTQHMLFGLFTGLASVSSGAAWVNIIGAVIIGGFAGFVAVLVADLLEALQIDDSLGVFASHGVGGALGALAIGLFLADGRTPLDKGIFLGGSTALISEQFVSLLLAGLFVGISATVILLIVHVNGYLRPVKKTRVIPTEYEYEPSLSDN